MRRIIYLLILMVLVVVAGLWLWRSDRGILWRAGLNPAKLTAYRVDGRDGYMMVYSNETTLITITRSGVSGLSVDRCDPKEWEQAHREWEPEHNQNPGKP